MYIVSCGCFSASVAVLSSCSTDCMGQEKLRYLLPGLYRKKFTSPCPSASYIELSMWEPTFCDASPKIQKVAYSCDNSVWDLDLKSVFLLACFLKHRALFLFSGYHDDFSLCFGFRCPRGDCLFLWGADRLLSGLSKWISHMSHSLHFKIDVLNKASNLCENLFSHIYLLWLKVKQTHFI